MANTRGSNHCKVMELKALTRTIPPELVDQATKLFDAGVKPLSLSAMKVGAKIRGFTALIDIIDNNLKLYIDLLWGYPQLVSYYKGVQDAQNNHTSHTVSHEKRKVQ